MSMRIELPFPDMKALNAHAKGSTHWAKSSATKRARELAHCIGLDMLNRKQCISLVGRVLISYSIYVPDNRKRDTCNILQACKPYVDGLVSSGLCEEDCWQQMTLYNVGVEIDRLNPRVEIVLHSTNGTGDMIAIRNAEQC